MAVYRSSAVTFKIDFFPMQDARCNTYIFESINTFKNSIKKRIVHNFKNSVLHEKENSNFKELLFYAEEKWHTISVPYYKKF